MSLGTGYSELSGGLDSAAAIASVAYGSNAIHLRNFSKVTLPAGVATDVIALASTTAADGNKKLTPTGLGRRYTIDMNLSCPTGSTAMTLVLKLGTTVLFSGVATAQHMARHVEYYGDKANNKIVLLRRITSDSAVVTVVTEVAFTAWDVEQDLVLTVNPVAATTLMGFDASVAMASAEAPVVVPDGAAFASEVIQFSTLSGPTGLLSTAPQPGMRATALDAPGSMLFEVGGKWGGDPGVFTSTTDPNYITYMAAIAAQTVVPSAVILIGTTPATAVAMSWSGFGYSVDGIPTFASTTERNAAYASVLPPYVGFPAYLPGGVRTEWRGPLGSNWDYAPDSRGVQDYRSVIHMAQNYGMSPVLQIIGDSTGANPYTWSGLLAREIAKTSRVEYYKLTDNATPGLADYGIPTVYGGGTKRGLLLGGQRGRAQSRTAVGDWGTALDVRVEANVVNWGLDSQQCFLSRFGAASKSFSFFAFYGTLRLALVQSETLAGENIQSTANIPFAANTTGWVRFTWTSGEVKFYTSTDGAAWTQLGETIVATTTEINKASLCDYAIGSTNGLDNGGAGASMVLNGTIYNAELRDGINGPVLTSHGMDSWGQQANDLNTLTGSPTVYVFNGSISGATVAYLTARLSKIVRKNTLGSWILNVGKNDRGPTFKSSANGLITAIKAIVSGNGYMKNQYPTIAPGLFGDLMAQAALNCRSICDANDIQLIDSYSNFIQRDNWQALLEPADGVHATAAGCLVDVQSVIPLIC